MTLTDEFVASAARVLRERLLPERRSFEMLDERMQDGSGPADQPRCRAHVRTCNRWLEVWEGSSSTSHPR